ncbi:hypothetical protein [Lyticum sinuosum]|uniref:50S ribosomal protein L31 n=1 Tax=Lyticum sinuosum TaxID=1332059 RepID=A0AAE5AHG6_9RICK|nr:hypothetical protein [Lyticum sinuosum]MDZ5761088.1 50S ribosomal protein L31 [Lyticum sinuosum]
MKSKTKNKTPNKNNKNSIKSTNKTTNSKKGLQKTTSSSRNTLAINEQQKIKGRRPLHPKLREITLIFPDGTEEKVLSTYKDDKIVLDDRNRHPAWNKDRRFVADDRFENVASLKSMFGDVLSDLV